MQKFIHDNFMLDLTSYQIDRVEENQWFSDDFFTKYTFPFELKITDEINRYFGGILDYNIESPVTVYNGYFFIDGGHEEAVLEIKDVKGKTATIEISYGLDEFPNWDTRLSELPLQKQELGESLFDHAEGIITQTYPAVNYNFVQVHTDSFNAEEDRWLGFEGIINNRKAGVFLLNEFDVAEDLTYNRNIMIPFPYLMHVLIAGFQDAGYELKGDVLTDPELLKIVFVKEAEEYINARIEGEEYVTTTDEYQNLYQQRYTFGFLSASSITTTLGRYEHEYTFPKRGRYKITGNIYLRRDDSEAEAKIYFKNAQMWRAYEGLLRSGFSEKIKYVDLVIDVDNLNDKLIIESNQINYGFTNDQVDRQLNMVDLTITPLAIYDENGDLIPPLITTEKLDLTHCVPDKTFGELVKMVKNWKNMDFRIYGNEVHMNYIEPQLNVSEAIDFGNFNLREPRRRYDQGDSFLLQFKDVDNENYTRGQLFVDIDGVQTSGFTTDDKTNEIDIDAIPLPLVYRGDVTTALAVNDGKSDFCTVLYNGATGIDNIAQEDTDVMLPAVYENHWSKWLSFRLRSQGFTTQFNVAKQRMQGVTTYDKVFMYNNFHLIKTLNKVNLPGKDVFQVELELESLK
ncbi:hypothetical protein [Maribacter sp. Hel_I_7]|uniref:hypothetical protein n=1 Tax=Maribacter sp. Hel_I_7 TaxID=1249997 RepID=UPI000AE43330|nr:hypothetical protein [Maribacter sp. Hel_I_7]